MSVARIATRAAGALLVLTLWGGGDPPIARAGGVGRNPFPQSILSGSDINWNFSSTSATTQVNLDAGGFVCRSDEADPPGEGVKKSVAGCEDTADGIFQDVDAHARADGTRLEASISFANSGVPVVASGLRAAAQSAITFTAPHRIEVKPEFFKVSDTAPPTSSGFLLIAGITVTPVGGGTPDFFQLSNRQPRIFEVFTGDTVEVFVDLRVDGDAAGTHHFAGSLSWNYVGRPCTTDPDCVDPNLPYCVDDLCRPGTLGSPCLDGDDCVGGFGCGSGQCAPGQGSAGQPCLDSEDCAFEHECVQSRCQPAFAP